MNLNGSRALLALLLSIAAAACGGDGGTPTAGGSAGRGGGPGGHSPPSATAAVPVEVTTASRRTISSFIETNGTLEAENEVDLVARVSAPIVALHVEEGDFVHAGQLLARLDDQETRVQTEIARVGLAEMRQAHERAQQLHAEDLISS